jgi:hypothetical protein
MAVWANQEFGLGSAERHDGDDPIAKTNTAWQSLTRCVGASRCLSACGSAAIVLLEVEGPNDVQR